MSHSRSCQRPVWAEINLSQFSLNLQRLQALTEKHVKLMAVIKANGYGHGAEAIAKAALKAGARCLAVAILDEAVLLREAGIKAPILVLGYTPPEDVQTVVDYNLSQAVFSMPVMQALSQAATKKGKAARIHIKLDTGMSRLGFQEKDLPLLEEVYTLPGLLVEGFMSHFATADETDKTFARQQLRQFSQMVASLGNRNFPVGCKHIANSAGLIELPEGHLDAVRPGIALFGYYPSLEVDKSRVSLQPVMTLKAKVAQVKRVPKGTPVSYGCTYFCQQETGIATLPLGYADGVPRRLSNDLRVAWQKKNGEWTTFNQVGRICMDQMMVEIGDEPVAEGDEVVLFGDNNVSPCIPTAEDWAQKLGTISYEILTGISKRIPRVYLEEKTCKVKE